MIRSIFKNRSFVCTLLLLSFCLFSVHVYAQSTCESQDNVSFSFTSPPKLDILDRDSARWPVDASLRFGYIGNWCPIPEEISFEDFDGNPVPAVIYFRTNTQLVENGPLTPQVALVKPMMSLEISTDYRLIISPEFPALAMYSDYTVEFRTARGPMDVDYDNFEGITEIAIDGNLCEGEGLFLSNPENFDCIVPSFLQVKVAFKPLPNQEVSYLVYRVSSTPSDPSASSDLIDEVERPLAFINGVSAERAARSVDVSFPVLYAPFPREECFKVVALDEWGRERAGFDQVECMVLDKPAACSDAQFPEPNPFENTPPIDGISCETIAINGASANTPIPQVQEDMTEEMEEDMEEEMMTDMDSSDDDGCAQQSNYRTRHPLFSLFILLLGLFTSRFAFHSLRKYKA